MGSFKKKKENVPALKYCKCFRLRCPFQDLNEPGWLLCLEPGPICAEGTAEKVAEGEAPVQSEWGVSREPGRRRDQLCPWLQMLPPRHHAPPGSRQTVLVPPGDEKG